MNGRKERALSEGQSVVITIKKINSARCPSLCRFSFLRSGHSEARTQELTQMAENSPNVDAALLRNAIRLVHCLQKERGLSCAYYANNTAFEAAMMEARSASDVAATLILRDDVPVASTLNKIRNLISKHRNPQASGDVFALHRIFVCYNTLISYAVHQYILKVISDGTDQKPKKSTIKNRHHRNLSFDINAKLSATTTLTPEAVGNHKIYESPSKNDQPRKLKTLNSMEELSMDDDDDNDSDEKQTPPPPPPPALSSAGNGLSDAVDVQKVTFASGKPKVQKILDLLHLFVQMKESAGVERAILSSLLAFRGTEDPSLKMLVSDLILEVEKQRSLINQLENLPEDRYRELVLELATLSPQLQELQEIILCDLESLKHAQYDSENIWGLITLYIDKLHSVELFLVEELECSLPVRMSRILSSASLSSMVPLHAIVSQPSPQKRTTEEELLIGLSLQQIFSADSSEDIVVKIEALEADVIKKRILEALGSNSPPEGSVGEGNYPHQYSAAISLKQDMNRALDISVRTNTSPTESNEWEISIYELKFSKRIGVGAAATTYLADWSDQEVAVKVASTSRFGLEGWRTEVDALKRLHHPNIIRLLGSVYHEAPLTYCLVLEYCNAGDLSTVIKYPTPKNFFFNVALGIANAMQYLHSRQIIHRDLKPANVLCHGNLASGQFTVKVTDFGVATDVKSPGGSSFGGREGSLSDKEARNLTGETGTYRWMASEVIRHEDYTLSADVFSFAVILWQLITREEPFMDVSALDAARLVAVEKERPPMPPSVPKAVETIITTNWNDDPTLRSSFEKISADLRKLVSSLTTEETAYLETIHGHPVYEYEEEPNSATETTESQNAKKAAKTPKQKRSSVLSSFFGQKRHGKK